LRSQAPPLLLPSRSIAVLRQLDKPVRGNQIELEAVLVPPAGGAARASVVVEKTGIGREISFRSDDLPILPRGEYYELGSSGRATPGAGIAPRRGRSIRTSRAAPSSSCPRWSIPRSIRF
jgi:hypothetical protein